MNRGCPGRAARAKAGCGLGGPGLSLHGAPWQDNKAKVGVDQGCSGTLHADGSLEGQLTEVGAG